MNSTAIHDNQIDHNSGDAPRHPPSLESAIADLLGRIPSRWAEFQPDALSEFESHALFLLIAAEMVERRVRSRARMLNAPVTVEFTVTATGEYGPVEAMEPILSAMEGDRKTDFESWKTTTATTRPPFLCELLSPQEWRLTACGELAVQELAGDAIARKGVFDFVLRRGFFFCRPAVRGHGLLVAFEKTNISPKPTEVSISNWDAGAEAFKSAFQHAFESFLDKAKGAGAVEELGRNSAPALVPPPSRDDGDDLRSAIEDPHDDSFALFMGKRIYLGHGDTQIKRLFWLLATPIGVARTMDQVIAAVEGPFNRNEEDFKQAVQRVRKAVSKLRKRLIERGLDDHLVIHCESAGGLTMYTMLPRFPK